MRVSGEVPLPINRSCAVTADSPVPPPVTGVMVAGPNGEVVRSSVTAVIAPPDVTTSIRSWESEAIVGLLTSIESMR